MPDADSLRNQLLEHLRPTRRRLEAGRVLVALRRALPWAAVIGASLCALRLATGYPGATAATLAALAPFGIQGARALRHRVDWKTAARVIDDRYALADRTLSAVSNVAEGELSPIAQLQVQDALGYLQSVDPRRAVELRLPPGSVLPLVVLVLTLIVNGSVRPAADRVSARGEPAGLERARIEAAGTRFEALPSELLTQAAGSGRPAGPLELQQRKETSHLGDNASVRRYFEQMSRSATSSAP